MASSGDLRRHARSVAAIARRIPAAASAAAATISVAAMNGYWRVSLPFTIFTLSPTLNAVESP